MRSWTQYWRWSEFEQANLRPKSSKLIPYWAPPASSPKVCVFGSNQKSLPPSSRAGSSGRSRLETLPRLQATLREADAAFGDLGRHLIRYSGTENKVRILVEHRDADVVDTWSARLRGLIEQELA